VPAIQDPAEHRRASAKGGSTGSGGVSATGGSTGSGGAGAKGDPQVVAVSAQWRIQCDRRNHGSGGAKSSGGVCSGADTLFDFSSGDQGWVFNTYQAKDATTGAAVSPYNLVVEGNLSGGDLDAGVQAQPLPLTAPSAIRPAPQGRGDVHRPQSTGESQHQLGPKRASGLDEQGRQR